MTFIGDLVSKTQLSIYEHADSTSGWHSSLLIPLNTSKFGNQNLGIIVQRESPSGQRVWAAPSARSPVGQASAFLPRAPLNLSLWVPPLSHLSTPSSQWITSPNDSVPKGPEGGLGKAVELCSTLPGPPGEAFNLLNLVSSSVRDRWSCPLHRALSTQPVGTLVIAGPTLCSLLGCLGPLCPLQRCSPQICTSSHSFRALGWVHFHATTCSSACSQMGTDSRRVCCPLRQS